MKPPLINSGITSALHSNEWDWIVAYGLILTGKTDMAFLRRHTRVNFPKFMHRCRVCYYTKDGSGWISASMKAGELVRTMPLTRLLDSAACDKLEREMRGTLY